MSDIVMLCHFDGDLTDEVGRHTLTSSLGCTSSYKKFGTHSLNATGTSRDITVTDNFSDFDFGTGNFTIDYWYYRLPSTNQVFFAIRNSSTVLIGSHYNNNLVYIYVNSTSYINTGVTHPTEEWVHNAIVRDGDTISFYLNGTRIWSNSGYSALNFSGTNQFYFGSLSTTSDMYGYVDEFRVLSGEAAWTGETFAVPTQPYSLGPDYVISGSLAESGKLILLSADDYSLISAEDVTSGSFEVGVEYGKKVVIVRNGSGKIEGAGEVMPTPV